jgi:type I restriction enzyme S subunit
LNSPFNEAKYKALLEGLEIAEVFISKQINTELFRLESEFYTAISFRLKNYFIGFEIIDFVQYGTSEELNENLEGYPILRLNEFDSSFIAKPSKYCKLIDKSNYEALKLKKDDVLICRTNGNPKLVGKSALVPQNYEYAYASYLFKIRPKRNLINSATLVVYLNSKYGRMEIEKFSMASNQVNFSPAKFREIRIPNFGSYLNKKIEHIVYNATSLLSKSKDLYQLAETLLLETLGLQDFQPSSDPINVKGFKESFLSSGRLDAEYYQRKYEDYLMLVKSYRKGFGLLSETCTLCDKNYNPEDNNEYKYIELSDIGKSGDISGCTIAKGIELPSRARRLVKTNDVIISSIEGSLESCALVSEEYNNALCSTGFYVINSGQINSETLLVLFKSEPMQKILKQNCSGTILTAINKTEFLNIPVPLIDPEIQNQIKEKISESFRLKKQSEHLLKTAKRAVEIAIEEGEEVGLEYINRSGD